MKVAGLYGAALLLILAGVPNQSRGQGVPDGGMLDSDHGLTPVICLDGTPDPITVSNNSASALSYAYIVTDDMGGVLAYPPGNTIDLDGATPGVCRIYGISYEGTLNETTGIPVTSVTASGAHDLSDNYIEVTRTVPDGGMLDSDRGLTPVICLDGTPDPITVSNNSTSALNYAYIVTDDMGGVLAYPPGNVIDLDGATPGVCRIYGISYEGTLNETTGIPVTNVTASGCHDLSGNYVEVTRIGVDGGQVMHVAGHTAITICLDANPDPLPMTNTSVYTDMPYTYIVTDDSGMVLAFPPGGTIDLNGATPGVCRIYGISYTGVLDRATGVSVGAVTSSVCSDLSDNYVRVTRHDTGSGCDTNISFEGTGRLLPNNTIALSIKTMYGKTYVLEATDSLLAPDWQPVLSDIVGNGELQDIAAPVAPGEDSRFYRFREQEPLHEKVGASAPLSTLAHDVSGTCTIVDNDTIEITNFNYDGGGIDVQVVVSANASFAPYTSISHDLVRGTPYNNETLTFDLPPTVSLDNVNYISIWCVPFGASFGDGQFN